ncbi:histidine kinase [soil metagenome]
MLTGIVWLKKPLFRSLQHILFWTLSFYSFLYIFKIGTEPETIDYIYTLLFHSFIIPPVYINLELLLPWVKSNNHWKSYFLLIIFLILCFSWLNLVFFSSWSAIVLPDYFFISYFNFFQIILFFFVYLSVTSLLKLSKSWFIVSELQNELLVAQKQKLANEKEMLELEAKALCAQMNPHFIFNCMNSIKSLIQQHDEDKAVGYLTTFSKLLRTILQNCDKREITLYDEIETCRLYTQLESMRFGNKLSYSFTVDETIDIKSIMVPALILQPFIENAIWHGIMPKEDGGILQVTILRNNDTINCIVEDDGIGREASLQNKPNDGSSMHQSRGVPLTQSRLELSNTLNKRNATVEIIDKTNSEGEAEGTRVILVFNEE